MEGQRVKNRLNFGIIEGHLKFSNFGYFIVT